MFCGACGHGLQAQDRFCPRCGRGVADGTPPPPLPESAAGDSQAGVCREQLINSYISGGGMVDTFSASFAHLQAAFHRFMAGGGLFVWNSAAFWSGAGIYLAYRKNYGEAFLATAAFALALWLGVLARQLGLALVVVFVAHIVLAGLVDRLIYGRFLKKEREAYRLFPGNSSGQVAYLSTGGGGEPFGSRLHRGLLGSVRHSSNCVCIVLDLDCGGIPCQGAAHTVSHHQGAA